MCIVFNTDSLVYELTYLPLHNFSSAIKLIHALAIKIEFLSCNQ